MILAINNLGFMSVFHDRNIVNVAGPEPGQLRGGPPGDRVWRTLLPSQPAQCGHPGRDREQQYLGGHDVTPQLQTQPQEQVWVIFSINQEVSEDVKTTEALASKTNEALASEADEALASKATEALASETDEAMASKTS